MALAGLREPELVLPTIGLSIESEGDLVDAIGTKKMLLLLDNFEQLIPAAADVGDLLARAPALKVLVTSRTPLRIAAEREFPLDPLDGADAVEFFLARAAAAGVALEPNADVDRLCRRLDRLPLALELAASRLKLLGLAGLLARLDRALPLLTSGACDAPARQRTLRAAIEWSYDLLGADAAALFPRLGVFAGTFTLDATETVSGADLSGIEELVDASLLKSTGDGRFAMLETIREFARDGLEASGDQEAISGRHAEWFLDIAERSETELAGPDQGDWNARLVADTDNLREAMAWAIDRGDATLASRFVAALWLFWYRRGDSVEADRWYDAVARLPGEVSEGLQARVGYGAAQVPMMRADWPRTRDELERTRELAESAGETLTLIRALSDLASTYHYLGDRSGSRRAFDDALLIARRSGDRPRTAMILGNAGHEALEDRDLPRAERLLGEALVEYRDRGDVVGLASVLHSLGSLEMIRGDTARAAELFRDGLTYARPTGMSYMLGGFLLAGAWIAATRGADMAAARLIGAALALQERLNIALYDLLGGQEASSLAREHIGGDAFESARAEGSKLELEPALDEAHSTFGGRGNSSA